MTDYLDKALDFIVEREQDNDYICIRLNNIPAERKRCAVDCRDLNRICVLRFLKVWKRKTNTSTHCT